MSSRATGGSALSGQQCCRAHVAEHAVTPLGWNSVEKSGVGEQASLSRGAVPARLNRYVTPGGFRESAMVAGLRGEQLDSTERRLRARLHLYSPGGQLACELAKNPTVLLLNDTLFAHGGVLPKHGARHNPPGWPSLAPCHAQWTCCSDTTPPPPGLA